MATAARDRLAGMLRGDAEPTFSVELTAWPDDLSLEVEGHGPVQFPVTPTRARNLIELARPAQFGRGEETVTDPEVRDTWEIPRQLVRASWNPGMLTVILATVRQELGLPNGAELIPDLHSLLVYEPNQFFRAHQDSEKDDTMVGTLVVTLPSSYVGGELMVGHKEEWKAYQGSKTALSLVAFYADCQHEVLRVKSGYRVTLTYNLLLRGDTSQPAGDAGTLAELGTLLSEHFSTSAPKYAYGPASEPPTRLVYLLDHEYTPRALGWARLKGADARRASLLRTAAEQAGHEAVLALADIKTSHEAFAEEDYEEYGYRDDYWDEGDDGDDGDDGSQGEFRIQDLIDSEVTLTHWTGPRDARLEATSLAVRDSEVCASTETGDLTPYSTEYEGYMGNWGNTLDRWYHRAAVVVWPRDQAFANRGETSPAWALDEVTAMAAAGDVTGARAAAASLAPFWDRAVRDLVSPASGPATELAGRALRAADGVADPELAAMLLTPFRVENFTASLAGPLAVVIADYGRHWMAGESRAWFGDSTGDTMAAWRCGAGPDRPRWVAAHLPGLGSALHGMGGDATAVARLLLELSWSWLAREIDEASAVRSLSLRRQALSALGEPLAAVLRVAIALEVPSVRDAVPGHVRRLEDAAPVLQLSALRAAAASSPGDTELGDTVFGDTVFGELAADCAAHLRARLALPPRAPGDWSITPPGSCACDLCATLGTFLRDPGRRTFEWPLAKERRRHVHSRIDNAELPVTHVTRRKGSPLTLVLTKSETLFTSDQSAREAAEADLEWLTRITS